MKQALHYSFFLILFVLCRIGVSDVYAQSALNSLDTVVTYNPKNPPPAPVYEKITKWVRVVKMNYNTDSYKCYIYKNTAFRLKFPKTYAQGVNDGKKYPIFLFFSGVGQKDSTYGNENQLYWGGQLWASRVDNGTFDGFLLFPMSTGGFWGTTEYINMKEVIDSIVAFAKGDPDRLYVNGLSSGGWGTWEFTLRYPQLVAAALPMSAMTLDYANHIDTYKFIPMWLFQGAWDGSPALYTTNQVVTQINAAGANFKLTVYPNTGHNTWVPAWNEPDFTPFMLRANRLNPYPLFGTTRMCPGDTIRAGISPGYQQYQWQKDGVTIATSTSNTIAIVATGTYRVRALLPTGWTGWSPRPLVITSKTATSKPVITTTPALASNVLPAPDGSTGVTMQGPAGMEIYQWTSASNSTVLSTVNTFKTSTAGKYLLRVRSAGNCISVYSDTFRVVAANGPYGPDAISNLAVTSSTDTLISLSWNDKAYPVYNEKYFEIYRGTTAGGPYILVGRNNANVVTYTDKSITANTYYFYRVRPVNDNAAGPVSAEVKGGNVNKPPVVAPIPNATVTAGQTLRINISGSDPENDAITYTGYNLPPFVTLNLSGSPYLQVSPATGNAGQFNNIGVIATDTHRNHDTATFNLTVNAPSGSYTTAQKLLLHFRLNVNAPAPWNNIIGNTANLKNDQGQTTGIGIKFDESWWAAGIEGPTTGNNSGVYPDVVLSEYLYFGSLAGFFTGAPQMHGHLTGLSANATYTIKFHSGSKWWAPQPDNGSTQFTINGVSKTLYADHNTTNTANFTNLTADAHGEIVFILSIPPGGQVGFLNALELDIMPNTLTSINTTSQSMTVGPQDNKFMDAQPATKGNLLVNVYPNPYADNLFVDLTLSKPAAILRMDICDPSGKVVYSETKTAVPEGRNLFQLNTSGSVVVSGIYILKITASSGETKGIKLMKK
ncbi:T9SS type A sorting domain-containing protein [Chitinophaga polysaccharea]|uniref:T9SS type A sorting domain-containing protein n=1 Tax=Chitinophaga polysaccharea TaxID=1293035 RepID=UPI0014552E37|nr:T9SS type A sorting domain-containing protein [Chitinophaga polysaccharea]NLR59277.1 T9SS type A sorting domain-containing protein [Chitinophaga polysaccharea]